MTILSNSILAGLAVCFILTTSVGAQRPVDTATKIDRIERQLRALQRRVFGTQGEGFDDAPVPGASQPVQQSTNPALVADLSVKLDSVERQLRTLTGRLEEFEFRQRQLEDRIEALSRETALNIEDIRRSNGARPGTTGQPAPSNQSSSSNQPGAAPVITTPNGTELVPSRAPSVALPDADPATQYQYAFAFIQQNELDNGRVAMEQFLAANPGDSRVGNAKYWLGRIHLLQDRPGQAAQRFFTLIEEHPNHSRRPDALIDLAQALIALDSLSDACNAIAEFERSASGASQRLRTRADRIRGEARCN